MNYYSDMLAVSTVLNFLLSFLYWWKQQHLGQRQQQHAARPEMPPLQAKIPAIMPTITPVGSSFLWHYSMQRGLPPQLAMQVDREQEPLLLLPLLERPPPPPPPPRPPPPRWASQNMSRTSRRVSTFTLFIKTVIIKKLIRVQQIKDHRRTASVTYMFEFSLQSLLIRIVQLPLQLSEPSNPTKNHLPSTPSLTLTLLPSNTKCESSPVWLACSRSSYSLQNHMNSPPSLASMYPSADQVPNLSLPVMRTWVWKSAWSSTVATRLVISSSRLTWVSVNLRAWLLLSSLSRASRLKMYYYLLSSWLVVTLQARFSVWQVWQGKRLRSPPLDLNTQQMARTMAASPNTPPIMDPTRMPVRVQLSTQAWSPLHFRMHSQVPPPLVVLPSLGWPGAGPGGFSVWLIHRPKRHSIKNRLIDFGDMPGSSAYLFLFYWIIWRSLKEHQDQRHLIRTY